MKTMKVTDELKQAVHDVLIQMAIDDKLPLDMTMLNINEVFSQAENKLGKDDDVILDRLSPYISYDDPQEVIDTWNTLTQEEIDNDLIDDHFTMIESMEYSSIQIKNII